jgi:hypothetical protein
MIGYMLALGLVIYIKASVVRYVKDVIVSTGSWARAGSGQV